MSAPGLLTGIVLLPFLGVLLGTLRLALGRRRSGTGRGEAWATLLGCGSALGSLLLATVAVARLLAAPAGTVLRETAWTWLTPGALETGAAGLRDLEFALSFQLDALSAVMLFVVTFVGFWIHLYSAGYMAGHRGFQRYFVYLNLFLGAMLLLVLGDNYLVLFMGWEGVGLCSYLLIGFDYEEEEPPRAGRKAFIVNRIGDFAFLVGMFALVARFGTLDFRDLQAAYAAAPEALGEPYLLGLSFAGFVGLCLFVGAVGKSAQIPLYVWLPDAMAGPTPVSALIHAATMVTAGVYMVARSSALYAATPEILGLIAAVGAATAIFAATIAIAQDDLKKVLAYSTVSQLGYMFLAAGCGAYAVAVFHLATHAFFKALLFLGSGSVIHALGGEQDMRRMGGLKARLPVTYWTFLIGTLALAGVPPLAGFFSKDRILAAAWGLPGGAGKLLWIVGLVTAGLTACYMARAVLLTFHGRFRGSEGTPGEPPAAAHGHGHGPGGGSVAEQWSRVHESPPVMTVPLLVLAAGSALVGLAGIPPLGHFDRDWIGHFLAPVLTAVPGQGHHPSLGLELLLMAASVLVAVLGLGLAWRFWGPGRSLDGDRAFARRAPRLRRLLAQGWRVDAVATPGVTRGVVALARGCARWDRAVIDRAGVEGTGRLTRALAWLAALFDSQAIDNLVRAVAVLCRALSRRFRALQSGWLPQHALTFVAGLLLLGAYCAFLWLQASP